MRIKAYGQLPALRIFGYVGGQPELRMQYLWMVEDMQPGEHVVDKVMKIITLWEPHSTLMALGEKKIETRGWKTLYRGPVAIHSAKGGLGYGELIRTYLEDPFRSCLMKDEGFAAWAEKWKTSSPNPRHALPVGHIIAVGNLIDCVRSESYRCLPGVFDEHPELDTPQERAFGDYEPGRFGLVFADMKRLREPVPFKSRQGKLLDIDPALEALISAQL